MELTSITSLFRHLSSSALARNKKHFPPLTPTDPGSRVRPVWLLALLMLSGMLASCSLLQKSPSPVVATIVAPVLEEQTFVLASNAPVVESLKFEVPDPDGGRAMLRMVHAHVSSGVISLNSDDKKYNEKYKINEQDDSVIEVPVNLKPGLNVFDVKLSGERGGQLTLSVLAPVDKIVLAPVADPVMRGTEKVVAKATVTGLGVPVPNVAVRFEVLDLGPMPARTDGTNAEGAAAVLFRSFPRTGKGTLQATLQVPGSRIKIKPLVDAMPITVVVRPTLKIQQSRSAIALEEGKDGYLTIAVDFTPGKPGKSEFRIVLDQRVEPSPKGISLKTDFPEQGWTSTGPLSVPSPVTVSALKAGTYTVTTTAEVVESGESASAELTVFVFRRGTTAPPILGAPTADPSGIPLGDSTSEVTFTTLVRGALPEVVTLWEVDTMGKPLRKIGALRDDGKNGDRLKNDRFYSATFKVKGGPENENLPEGEKRYLVEVVHEDQAVRSTIGRLVVTPFPIGPASINPADAIRDPKTGQQFAPDEILVKFKRGLTASQIEYLVSKHDAKVIGYLPASDIYEVMIPGAGQPDDVRAATAYFETLPEVEFAVPNGILFLGGPISPDKPCVPPNDSVTECQWAAGAVRADEAWLVARGREPNIPANKRTVAVVDTGINPDADLPVSAITYNWNVANASTSVDPDTDGHGTRVARIIAARRGNGGITGIAPEANIANIQVVRNGDVASYFSDINAGLQKAVNAPAHIINLSMWDGGVYSPGASALAPLQAGVSPPNVPSDRLIVGIAGNKNRNNQSFPGAYFQVLAVGATESDNTRAAPWPDGTGRCGTGCGSGYGTWVELAAPGENVCTGVPEGTGVPDGQCNPATGTSFAAPHVSGTAAVLWSREPGLSAVEVRNRLKNSAKELELGQFGGAGLLDMFEAVFNGNFELGELDVTVGSPPTIDRTDVPGWTVVDDKNCGRIGSIGAITPENSSDTLRSDKMAICQTGPVVISRDQPVDKSVLESLPMDIPSDITEFTAKFDYQFVTDEYDGQPGERECTAPGCDPDWIGWLGPDHRYDDRFSVELVDSSDRVVAILCTMDVDVDYVAGSPLPDTPFVLSGLDPPDAPAVQNNPDKYPLDGGILVDRIAGALSSGTVPTWNYQLVTSSTEEAKPQRCDAIVTIPDTVPPYTPPYKFRISIEDKGDQLWDSYIFIDRIQFE